MDIDAIALGDDFVKAIEKRVSECDVLIAIIGAHWLSSTDEQDGRRLDNPEDFVRMEIAKALRRDIRVIPVLVDGALMPRSSDLPDDLKQLVRRNALQVGDTHFDDDCRRLVAAIEQVLEENTAARREREEKERLAREEKERLEAQRLENERLDAQRRQREEVRRLEIEHREHEDVTGLKLRRSQDWADEIRYEVLLRLPEVRDLIAHHASESQKRISGEDFLELCDKAFVPLTGESYQTVPLVGGFSTLVPSDAHRSTAGIWAKIGVKTGKTRKEFFTAPTGKVLVAAICSWLVMDSRSIELNKVKMVVCSTLQFRMIYGVSQVIFLLPFNGRTKAHPLRPPRSSKLNYMTGANKRILTNLFNDIRALPI